jgi:hypothetical protein
MKVSDFVEVPIVGYAAYQNYLSGENEAGFMILLSALSRST